jgi:uncharacterized membrane protein YedE/YeeE
MENFTPIPSLLGGALIGLSSSLMLLLHGRIAGITGILGGAVDPETAPSERVWRLVFVAGLVLGAWVLLPFLPANFELGVMRSTPVLVLAGILVGWGTRLGSGCTSGHGVCGISRGSKRSLLATMTFIASGAATVWLYRTVVGE